MQDQILDVSPNFQRDWLDRAEALAGDAFYLLNVDKFKANVTSFQEALVRHYPNTSFAYSYKTNYIPALIHAASSLGMYSEVVSRTELEIALSLDVPGERIIFNGPLKSRNDLLAAFGHRALVNVDSLHELQTIREILETTDSHTDVEIGLRVGFELPQGQSTRFGICVENGDFRTACKLIEDTPKLRLAGLHCHFSVSSRSVDSYRFRIRKLIELAGSVGAKHNIRFLDVGGGFAGTLSDDLERILETSYPTYSDYAAAIGSELASAYGNDDGPELILEPGMGLVADVMKFVCKVQVIKNTSSHATAITSGSIFNVKPFLHSKNIPFQVVRSLENPTDAVHCQQISGYTCMEVDILYRNYAKKLCPGDFLVFENCGAYTVVLLPPFIRFAPPILLDPQTSATPELVAHAVRPADVMSRYC